MSLPPTPPPTGPPPFPARAGPDQPVPVEPATRTRPGRRSLLLAASIVVLAFLGVIAGFLILQGRNRPDSEPVALEEPVGDSPDQSGGPGADGSIQEDSQDSASDAEGASDPDQPDLPEVPKSVEHLACPADVPTDLCELAEFVETVRGRPFRDFPVIELEENEEFDRRLLELFDEEATDLEASGYVLRSLGLIPREADLVALIRATLEIGVVGYYDTDTKGLVVRGKEFNLYSKLVLVHELTHAHDDQWIGLERPEFEDVDDESDYGLLAVTEGNASRVENQWRNSLSAQEQEELTNLEFNALSPEDLQTYLALPRFILLTQISPYVDGRALVEDIAARGGEDAIDDAFENPPTSSEQVLHPDQYRDRTIVDERPLPDADGTIVDDGVIGELGFRHWLGTEVGEGWGGDHYVTWLEGDRACTRIKVWADTAQDLAEIELAAQDWASGGSRRSVDQDGDTIVIVGCS